MLELMSVRELSANMTRMQTRPIYTNLRNVEHQTGLAGVSMERDTEIRCFR